MIQAHKKFQVQVYYDSKSVECPVVNEMNKHGIDSLVTLWNFVEILLVINSHFQLQVKWETCSI